MRRSKDNRKLSLSDCYCTSCGCKTIPIFRQAGKEREPGHLKKMFCLNCNDYKNTVEVKSVGKYTLDDFWIEYEYKNFDKEGNRKEPWRQFVMKIRHILEEGRDNYEE